MLTAPPGIQSKLERAILAGDVRFGPHGVTAEAVGIDRGYADEKGKRNRANGNAADQLLGKTKLPSEEAVDGRAGERQKGN